MPGQEPSIQPRVQEMLDPAAFGAGTKQVQMLQTHTSWVFLTGEYAYKVKKPVNFGFLDYTTLTARKFFCEEELRLNQALSPDIYVAVLPVVERRYRLRVGGSGRVVDWCLKMKELPQSWIMTEQLKAGRVTFEHIDGIARSIADFHQRAERGREVSQYGSTETVRLNWDENFSQTMEFRGRTIGYNAFAEIKASVERFIVEHRPLFRYRREAGFVRRCHGDLHSKNIFVLGEAARDKGTEGVRPRSLDPLTPRSLDPSIPQSLDPSIPRPLDPLTPRSLDPSISIRVFDCIEFNPRFSCSDVASEIAFMVMDLEYSGRRDLAGYFVERYLVYSRDPGLLRLLDFYKCYRAYVRGKVTSFNLNDPGMSKKDKAQARLVARRYFDLSRRYAARLFARPKLVVMMGLPGTGKSFVARRLAERLDAFHLMSDSIRKQLLGISLSARRFEGYGKGIYQGNIGRKTYDEMMGRARVFASAGHSTIMDATFLHPDSRRRARALARKTALPLLFVFADCPERTVVSRLGRRTMEGSFSDATIAVYREMKRRFKPPRPGRDTVRINTREPLSKSLARIERALLRI
ncbi:hypothetical protein FJY69_05475 [candidate division WOR-3 bacterium]|nr:hypothetical protein [candidate division WOR-3 bacterium]